MSAKLQYLILEIWRCWSGVAVSCDSPHTRLQQQEDLWWHVNLKHLQGFAEKCPRNIWGTICYTYIKFIAAVVRGQNSRLRDTKTSLSVLRGIAMT